LADALGLGKHVSLGWAQPWPSSGLFLRVPQAHAVDTYGECFNAILSNAMWGAGVCLLLLCLSECIQELDALNIELEEYDC
jgi:hypothetical protein